MSARCDDGVPSFGAASSRHVARKVVVAVVGSTVVTIGVALIVLPVPGVTFLLIPLGLAILAGEFSWARKLLNPVRTLLRRITAGAQRGLGQPGARRSDE